MGGNRSASACKRTKVKSCTPVERQDNRPPYANVIVGRIIIMNALVSFRLCKLSDKELIEKVDKLTDEMYQTGELPTRHIPARPDSDYDLLVGELITRFNSLIKNEEPEGGFHVCSVEIDYQNEVFKVTPANP